MDLDTLPADLRAAVADELAAGEKLLWSGRPGRTAMGSWWLVLFGVPWMAFAIFWTFLAAGMGAQAGGPNFVDTCIALFGVPFVLVGVGLLSAPYWVRRWASRTMYVVTDRRAIVFQGGLGIFKQLTVRSFPPGELRSITRTQRPDGSGDLVFHEHYSRDSDGYPQVRRVGFFGIPNVKWVEDLLRELAARPVGHDQPPT